MDGLRLLVVLPCGDTLEIVGTSLVFDQHCPAGADCKWLRVLDQEAAGMGRELRVAT